jgi:hypothetical protein
MLSKQRLSLMSFVCLLLVEAVSFGQQIKSIGSFVSPFPANVAVVQYKKYYDHNEAANSAADVTKRLIWI